MTWPAGAIQVGIRRTHAISAMVTVKTYSETPSRPERCQKPEPCGLAGSQDECEVI